MRFKNIKFCCDNEGLINNEKELTDIDQLISFYQIKYFLSDIPNKDSLIAYLEVINIFKNEIRFLRGIINVLKKDGNYNNLQIHYSANELLERNDLKNKDSLFKYLSSRINLIRKFFNSDNNTTPFYFFNCTKLLNKVLNFVDKEFKNIINYNNKSISHQFYDLCIFFINNKYYYSFNKDSKGCFAYAEINNGKYYSFSGLEYNSDFPFINYKGKNHINDNLINEIKRKDPSLIYLKASIKQISFFLDINNKRYLVEELFNKKYLTLENLVSYNINIFSQINLYNCSERILLSNFNLENIHNKITVYTKWAPCDQCKPFYKYFNLNSVYCFKSYKDFIDKLKGVI